MFYLTNLLVNCVNSHLLYFLFLCIIPWPEFSVLRKLLSLDDEQVVGNAALCLSHCVEIPGAAASLLKTDIVRMLLKHAGGDANETSLQQNAAIALSKLCLAEPR